MNTPIVDCHTHTSFSDGTSTFEENMRAAAAAGLAVLACTDHLTLPASMEAVADAQVPRAPDRASRGVRAGAGDGRGGGARPRARLRL